MSIGQYVLQVTPKKFQFKQPHDFIKLSTSLEFGQLTYKSPFARFIRSNQASFHGQRLKLSNNINANASLTIVGINAQMEETEIVKISINIIDLIEKEDTAEKVQENQDIVFSYEVSAIEREISEEDYQEILSGRGSDIAIDSEPILANILSDIQQKNILSSPAQQETPVSSELILEMKQGELPETPRLRQEVDRDEMVDLKLDHSPIAQKVVQTEDQTEIPTRMRRSSLKTHTTLQFADLEGSISPIPRNSPSGSRVRFTQPVLEPRETKIGKSLTLALYASVSLVSFFVGIYMKQNFKY